MLHDVSAKISLLFGAAAMATQRYASFSLISLYIRNGRGRVGRDGVDGTGLGGGEQQATNRLKQRIV